MIYVVGDVHGHYDLLVEMLQRSDLIDASLNWQAGEATLCFIGDYFDRGPKGIDIIELLMHLQKQAAEAGGQVIALLGNHEVFFLSACVFKDHSRFGHLVVEDWKSVGGMAEDIERVTDEHIAWLSQLPVMARVDDLLLIHADSVFYAIHGTSIEEVNEHIHGILQEKELSRWNQLIKQFVKRGDFYREPLGKACAIDMLDVFGGERIIHGHTPITYMSSQLPTKVKEAFVYNDGLCINVDGGLYLGGLGFVYVAQKPSKNHP